MPRARRAPRPWATSGAALGITSSGVVVATSTRSTSAGGDAGTVERQRTGVDRVRGQPLLRRGDVAGVDPGAAHDPLVGDPDPRRDLGVPDDRPGQADRDGVDRSAEAARRLDGLVRARIGAGRGNRHWSKARPGMGRCQRWRSANPTDGGLREHARNARLTNVVRFGRVKRPARPSAASTRCPAATTGSPVSASPRSAGSHRNKVLADLFKTKTPCPPGLGIS